MFKSARIKLTAWYLLIIMLVSGFFSMVIYRVITSEVDRLIQAQKLKIERRMLSGDLYFPDFDNRPFIPLLDPELVTETKNRLIVNLLFINGGILILSGVLGYVLAGRTLKPIQDMVDDQNQFVSDASHELRTPLTSLKSAMEVGLRDKKITLAEAKVLIKENILEVDKLKNLSDDLLLLSQFRKPNGYDKFDFVSLKDVVEIAVKKIYPISKLKDIDLKTDVVDVKIEANQESLVSMLVIFLDNAVKYTHNGKSVMVTVSTEKNTAVIKVIDEGIGIDTQDMPHIFERFYRADSARAKHDSGGFGLGLPIAKKISDFHSGVIKVTSKSGKGTVFSVKIPIHRQLKIGHPLFFS